MYIFQKKLKQVLFKMSLKLFQFILVFHNISGFSCHRFSNQTFAVSKILLFANILKILICLFTALCLSENVELRSSFFRDDWNDFENFSQFSKLTITISARLVLITSIVLFLIQIVKRKKMETFLNASLKIPVDDSVLSTFRLKYIKDVILWAVLYFTLTLFKFLLTAKVSFLSFLAYYVSLLPSFIVQSLIISCKIFQNFATTLLKSLRDDIKQRKLNKSLRKSFKAQVRHDEIYVLVCSFNDTFGTQMTAVICCITFMIVLHVSLIKFLLRTF